MTVNVHEAKTRLSELLQQVEAGEDIVIARAGQPVARLVLVQKPSPHVRTPGSAKGEIWIAEDFNDPLPPEIQQYFE